MTYPIQTGGKVPERKLFGHFMSKLPKPVLQMNGLANLPDI